MAFGNQPMEIITAVNVEEPFTEDVVEVETAQTHVEPKVRVGEITRLEEDQHHLKGRYIQWKRGKGYIRSCADYLEKAQDATQISKVVFDRKRLLHSSKRANHWPGNNLGNYKWVNRIRRLQNKTSKEIIM